VTINSNSLTAFRHPEVTFKREEQTLEPTDLLMVDWDRTELAEDTGLALTLEPVPEPAREERVDRELTLANETRVINMHFLNQLRCCCWPRPWLISIPTFIIVFLLLLLMLHSITIFQYLGFKNHRNVDFESGDIPPFDRPLIVLPLIAEAHDSEQLRTELAEDTKPLSRSLVVVVCY